MKFTAPDDLWVPDLDAAVTKGQVVDVDDELGARLAAQGWKPANPPAKKAAKAEED